MVQADLKRTQLVVERDVSGALAQLITAERNVAAAQAGVDSAREGVRTAQGRYQVALGTLTDVLDAQSSLVTARNNLAKLAERPGSGSGAPAPRGGLALRGRLHLGAAARVALSREGRPCQPRPGSAAPIGKESGMPRLLASLFLSLLVTMLLNPLLLDFTVEADYKGLIFQFGSIFVLFFLLLDMLWRKHLRQTDQSTNF